MLQVPFIFGYKTMDMYLISKMTQNIYISLLKLIYEIGFFPSKPIEKDLSLSYMYKMDQDILDCY